MKIGLINPSYEYIVDHSNPDIHCVPGLMYINSALKKSGYETKVIDFLNNPNASLEDTKDCNVIGISAYINNYEFLKQALPKIEQPVIVGGTLITSYGMRDNLMMRLLPEIDYAVIGEGEKTIVELLEHIKDESLPVPRGVIKRTNKGLIATGPRKIEGLEDKFEIDYSDWPHFVKQAEGKVFNWLSSRGCYNQCSFCFKPHKGVRTTSLSNIEKELEKISQLKPRLTVFGDEVFTYDKERAMAIGKIAKKFDLTYRVLARVNDADEELLNTLKETGCIQIKYGIESFDETILKKARKNITNEQIYNAIKLTWDAGIEPIGFMLVGLPGESKQSIENSLRGIKETEVKPRPRIVVPLPGTQLYQQAINNGLLNEVDLLEDFARFDAESGIGKWVPANFSDGLTDQELLDARDKMHELRKELDKKYPSEF